MLELPRVLVVDAEAEALCDELARLGLEATAAVDANAALACLADGDFDMILVEMSLPGLSGVGLLRRLSRMGNAVPFVGTSADPSPEDLVQLIRGGAADFLIKPFAATDVEDALERLSRRASAAPDRSRRRPSAPERSAPASHRSSSRPGAPLPLPAAASRDPHVRAALDARSPSHHRASSAPAPRVLGQDRAAWARDHNAAHAASPPALVLGASPPPGSAPDLPGGGPIKPPVPQRHADPMQDMLIRLRNGEVELPAIAPIANDIQDLLDRPECGVDQVVGVVSRDPSVVAGVLRLANSGRYGTSKGITDIRQACLRLGNQRVLALAQQLVVGGMYVLSVEPFASIVTDLWRNTLVCAQGARKLADVLEVADREALFVGAMLHNVGELALLRVLSELPDRIPPGPEGLRQLGQVLGGAHEEFGSAILKRWRMPPRFVRIASAHHHAPRGPEDRVAKQQRLISMVAWTMALREGYLYLPGQQPPELAPLLEGLDLSLDDVNSAFSGCRKWVNKDGTLNGSAA